MSIRWETLKTAEQIQHERLDVVYRRVLQRIAEGHAIAMQAVTERYPQTERDGWAELVEDAVAGAGSCIEAYAQNLDVSVATAATRILAARDGFRSLWGEHTGTLTALRDAADAAYQAEDLAALEAIDWPEPLVDSG